MPVKHQSTGNPRCLSRDGQPEQLATTARGSSDDIRKRMGKRVESLQPFAFANILMILQTTFMPRLITVGATMLCSSSCVRRSLLVGFREGEDLEKELRQMLQDRKRCSENETKERDEDDQQQALG
ncbi:hypothetical protein GQ600_9141 [Phytophthora cactorum]|nr:hypothetical protein GQ600_9141 [Phytophthora cactorum]